MSLLFSSKPVGKDALILVVRLVFGVFLVYHGWEVFAPEKMAEYAKWDQFKSLGNSASIMVYVGKIAELVAGILFVIGLWSRLACVITIGVMGYITFFVGNGVVWYGDQHPFMFVLLALLFLAIGSGRYAVANYLKKDN